MSLKNRTINNCHDLHNQSESGYNKSTVIFGNCLTVHICSYSFNKLRK